MPTYRNDTEKRITHSDKSYMEWRPGEEKRLAFFVPHELLGLTRVSEEPYVQREPRGDFGYAEMKIGGNTPIENRRWKIPYCETFELSVFVRGGLVKMFFGDSLKPVIVDERNNHVGHYPWDQTAYLTFEASGNVIVYVKSEPFTFKGPRETQ